MGDLREAGAEGCDHMRGAIPDPPGEQRMKEVSRAIDKLCRGGGSPIARLEAKIRSGSRGKASPGPI